MSYTSLVLFKGGKPDSQIEYRNAWGGAARIWDAMFKCHVPKKSEYDSWMSCLEDKRLWNLAVDESIPMFERVVHGFMFDYVFVRNEHFKRMAEDLRKFVEKHPAGQCVDHLPAWADWLDSADGVEAVGIYATSVGENLWYRQKSCEHCGNQTDETEAVPLTEGTEVYDWLDSLIQESAGPNPARKHSHRPALPPHKSPPA